MYGCCECYDASIPYSGLNTTVVEPIHDWINHPLGFKNMVRAKFCERESDVHRLAKEITQNHFLRLYPSTVLEYPLSKESVECAWTSPTPSFHECTGNNIFPVAVIDVMCCEEGRPVLGIEICHTNPVSNQKINRMESISFSQGFILLEFDASSIVESYHRTRMFPKVCKNIWTWGRIPQNVSVIVQRFIQEAECLSYKYTFQCGRRQNREFFYVLSKDRASSIQPQYHRHKRKRARNARRRSYKKITNK